MKCESDIESIHLTGKSESGHSKESITDEIAQKRASISWLEHLRLASNDRRELSGAAF